MSEVTRIGPELPARRRLRKALGRALVGRTVAEVERDLILGTLAHCQGNRTHAARMLGISIRTLRNKMGEYTNVGICLPDRPGSGCPRVCD